MTIKSKGTSGCVDSCLRLFLLVFQSSNMALKVPKANNLQLFKEGYKAIL